MGEHTFFSYQRIVAVVGVIGIASGCTTSISKGTKVEFCASISPPWRKENGKVEFLTCPKIHDQTAQSVLSCVEEISCCRKLGNIVFLLISNVKGFAGGGHARIGSSIPGGDVCSDLEVCYEP